MTGAVTASGYKRDTLAGLRWFDLNPALGQQLLHIPVRKAMEQIATDR